MGRFARVATLALVLAAILGTIGAGPRAAAAQDGSEGWYGPFDDGCYYYWDGYDYSDYDCSSAGGSGYAAGWYDGGDGCLYYYDGYQYTGDYDCGSSYAGWYDGGDGCLYWWDGYQYTGESYCESATTSYAGWYGPFDDGCYYYWDGYNYTESDCGSTAPANSYAAGWYGPFDDGCYYYWDGYDYTGDYDCSSVAQTLTQVGPANWYGPYSDGCYYYWDGYSWTGETDCSQSSYQFAAADWYGPFNDGCYYWWDGYQYTGEKDCPATTTFAAGWYGPYQDGCLWWWDGSAWGTYSCPVSAVAGAGTAAIIAGTTVGGTDQGWQLVTNGGGPALGPTVVGGAIPSDMGSLMFNAIRAGSWNPSVMCTYFEDHGQTYCGI